VRLVDRDAVPAPFRTFPGTDRIEVADRLNGSADAVVVLECSTLARPDVAGLDALFVINIDHHAGNTMYGAVNWFDVSAAACGEMVFDLVAALDVPLTLEIATHVYVAILTDTGSFHYSSITPRTFDICRQCTEAGVSPPAVARSIFDSNNLGRLKLFGAVLSRMRLDDSGRIAIVDVDRQLAQDCGGTYDDTEGLINLPLTVKEILAVVFFKENGPGDWRISMRSKGEIDGNAVAKTFGGGGHKNASGCSARGTLAELTEQFRKRLTDAIERAGG
jgi:phosphoesterase RecJ-like protein